MAAGWWLNNPSEKYARQSGKSSPIRGENKKMFETTT